ncbi:MAG: hypothetical protein UZ22_OP11002001030 [Microgenomates bacterium OLB23]|nr:MAG: hypothetical protein UZ22_OP11002001030 [Microgenomates bacterium OLB23]
MLLLNICLLLGPHHRLVRYIWALFYYYFYGSVAFLFFNMNPIGPVVGIAFFSTLFIVVTYLMVADLFDKKTAIFASVLIAFSAVLIDLSRFSWNPNLLPMSSFIAVYFFIKSLSQKNRMYPLLTGLFAGISFQLHYVTFALLFAFFVVTFFRKHPLLYIKSFLLALVAFASINIPLVLFDIRHGFLNAKNFIALFSSPSSQGDVSLSSIYDGVLALHAFAFSTYDFAPLVMLIPFVGLIWTLKVIKNTTYKSLLTIFFLTLVPTSIMTAQKISSLFWHFVSTLLCCSCCCNSKTYRTGKS